MLDLDKRTDAEHTTDFVKTATTVHARAVAREIARLRAQAEEASAHARREALAEALGDLRRMRDWYGAERRTTWEEGRRSGLQSAVEALEAMLLAANTR